MLCSCSCSSFVSVRTVSVRAAVAVSLRAIHGAINASELELAFISERSPRDKRVSRRQEPGPPPREADFEEPWAASSDSRHPGGCIVPAPRADCSGCRLLLHSATCRKRFGWQHFVIIQIAMARRFPPTGGGSSMPNSAARLPPPSFSARLMAAAFCPPRTGTLTAGMVAGGGPTRHQ